MVGFGFGDAVIVELLKERGLMPELSASVEDVVIALGGTDMQVAATSVATQLRAQVCHTQGWCIDVLYTSLCFRCGWYSPDKCPYPHAVHVQGRSVDLVIESKKMKWAFKHADRLAASRLVRN
jgi:histidyl-tRNA synthetase